MTSPDVTVTTTPVSVSAATTAVPRAPRSRDGGTDGGRGGTDDRVWVPSPAQWRQDVWWLLTLAVVAIGIALVPTLFNDRFYFADDTQAGAWPIWVNLGETLRSGSLPFFEPTHWQAGNIAAEGQWGLLNPVIWLIGLFAATVGDGVVVSTVVKAVFLGIAAVGTFLLVRSFGGRRGWSFAAGVLASCGGFTVYIDAASWVTSLFVWALLPLTWWGLRLVSAGRNPLYAVVPGYVLVTTGYVHGTIMLTAVILGVLLEVGLTRQWRTFWRVFAAASVLGLVAIAVFLPGVMASPVTARLNEVVSNTNFMSPTLSELAASAAPTGRPWLSGFWATPPNAPLMYIAFLVPAVVLIDFGRARALATRLASVFLVGLISAGLVFGPSEIGPLRFPARLYPYVALVVLVLGAVYLSRARRPVTRGRVLALLVWLAVSTGFAFAETPDMKLNLALGTLVAVAGLLGAAWAAQHGGWRLAGVVTVAALAVALVQHWAYPKSPLPELHLPAERATYSDLLTQAEGDTMVIGIPTRTPETWQTTTYANGWLLSDTTVINVYSPIQHRGYSEDLCADAHGVVCWETLDTLFTVDETTGLPVIDLLSVSSLQILPRSEDTLTPDGGTAQDPYTHATVPPGWHEVSRDPASAVWVRDEPLPSAGGVTWTTPGLDISDISVGKTQVTFRVDAAPAEGGLVVLSRLDWPGYSVSNAEMTESTRGYLLTLSVPPDSVGETVTLTFVPAGWRPGLAALALALVGGLGWAVGEPVTRRLRRRS